MAVALKMAIGRVQRNKAGLQRLLRSMQRVRPTQSDNQPKMIAAAWT